MSHFTVMVIGDDPEQQLAPFHEFECTGHNDEYVQEIDKTDELRLAYDSYLQEGGSDMPALNMREYLKDHEGAEDDEFLAVGQTPKIDGAHKWGYYVLDQGDLVKAVRRTNPNAKWDWYQLGGRWQGFLKLKPEYAEAIGHLQAFKARGSDIPDSLLEKVAGIHIGEASLLMKDHKYNRFYCDAAPKGKIDWDGMVSEHLDRVMPKFDEVQQIINGRPWQTWNEVREAHRGNIEAARAAFHAQPVVQDLHEVTRHTLFVPWEDFKKSRDAYVAEQSLAAVSTFAMIKDSQWYEQGSMGWFGMVADEKDQTEWSTQLIDVLNQLDDDTLISVYDCHI